MMRIGWGMMICLWAAVGVSVSPAQQANTKKTTHRSPSRPAHSTRHAKHAASKPAEKTEAYVNQGPVAPAPAAATEVKTAATEPAMEAAPVAEPVVVTYERGALAITTHEAPLREVLDKVREATGAVVEAPNLEQRVSVTVAAEAPVQAIAALLDGMHLDYAMLGGTSAEDPVRRIIIAPRLAATPGLAAAGHAPAGIAPEQSGGDEGAWEKAPKRPARDH